MNFSQKLEYVCVQGKLLERFWQFVDRKLGGAFRYFWARFQKIDNNKIVFMTYSKRFECNPKYIAEELIRRNCPYELIWITPKGRYDKRLFPPQIKHVRQNSFESYEARATAKIWIDNSINFTWGSYIRKKKGQIYINTWHGSMGLKRVGKEDQKNKYWAKRATKCGKITDFCISDSTFEDNVYRTTYWDKTPILKYGHARNDILFDSTPERQNDIRYRVLTKLKVMPEVPDESRFVSEEERLYIHQKQKQAWDTHYVLYAPTFRDSGTFDCYNLDFQRVVENLQVRFGGRWKVLMRFHFHNRGEGRDIEAEDLFVNATRYPDMQELMCVADVGVTDYSSWICDYALTGKPGFIYAVDLAEYNTERGLYYPLETTPFPVATNNDEMQSNILNFDSERFETKRQEFLEDKGCVEDGHAAERIVDKIEELMNEGLQ